MDKPLFFKIPSKSKKNRVQLIPCLRWNFLPNTKTILTSTSVAVSESPLSLPSGRSCSSAVIKIGSSTDVLLADFCDGILRLDFTLIPLCDRGNCGDPVELLLSPPAVPPPMLLLTPPPPPLLPPAVPVPVVPVVAVLAFSDDCSASAIERRCRLAASLSFLKKKLRLDQLPNL